MNFVDWHATRNIYVYEDKLCIFCNCPCNCRKLSRPVILFKPSLDGEYIFHRSCERFFVAGQLLLNTMTILGVLNFITWLSYLEVVAAPSLISSKIRYIFTSSPIIERESLNKKMSTVVIYTPLLENIGNFFVFDAEIATEDTVISVISFNVVLEKWFSFVSAFVIDPRHGAIVWWLLK